MDTPSSTRMPPFSALRAFEAVARLGSLSRAAAELHVTKSAVSHQLRALEDSLGTSLLHRGGAIQRAEPTEIGSTLLSSVQRSLAILENACRSTRIAAQGGQPRRLTISANASFASLWLVPRLRRFVEQRQDVDTEIRLHTNQNPAWKAGDVDIAFMHVRDHGPHRTEPDDIPLMQETIVPVCSPVLIAPSQRSNPDVFRLHPWITERHVASPETAWRLWQTRLGLGEGPRREPLILHGMSTVVSAAVAGLGIALGRSPLIDEELASQRLVTLTPDLWLAGSWRYAMRLRPGRPRDDAMDAFIEFCLKEAQTSPIL